MQLKRIPSWSSMLGWSKPEKADEVELCPGIRNWRLCSSHQHVGFLLFFWSNIPVTLVFSYPFCISFPLWRTQKSDFTGSVYQKVNESLQSGVSFGWSVSNNETHLALGCIYKIDDSSSWKVNLESLTSYLTLSDWHALFHSNRPKSATTVKSLLHSLTNCDLVFWFLSPLWSMLRILTKGATNWASELSWMHHDQVYKAEAFIIQPK